jgi:hypothetical protein
VGRESLGSVLRWENRNQRDRVVERERREMVVAKERPRWLKRTFRKLCYVLFWQLPLLQEHDLWILKVTTC